MSETQEQLRYVYGPVKSWRSGTSLGIDPIGKVSTCSFNCSYCQLGKIQKVTNEIKVYVDTQTVIKDFLELEEDGRFKLEELDVITFAGSGEPTLAENLGEMIDELKAILQERNLEDKVKISILTNATMLNDKAVRERVLKADLVSLKLDAPDDNYLKSINQADSSVSVGSIVSGIKLLREEVESGLLRRFAPRNDVHAVKFQLQIMFLEKYAKDKDYIRKLCELINEIGIYDIQINTPSRPKPVSKTGEYWIETRGNHYSSGQAPDRPDYIELKELPVIDKETAFCIEKEMRELLTQEASIINIYKP